MKRSDDLQNKTPEQLMELVAQWEQAYQALQTQYQHKEAELAGKDKALSDTNQKLTDKQQKLATKTQEAEEWQHKYQALLNHLYGPKQDKSKWDDGYQLGLFDEASLDKESEDTVDQEETVTVPEHQRKKRSRKRLPNHWPRYAVDHDLDEADTYCDCCGERMSHTNTQVHEQAEKVPAQFYVKQHRRHQYACRSCEGTIRTSHYSPSLPIDRSQASPSLLSDVIVNKYRYHLPLYRQATILRNIGMDTDRKTLSNWILKVGDLIEPLLKMMRARVEDYDIASADETTIQVLKEQDRDPSSLSYMWVFLVGPPHERCKIYHYAPSRSSTVVAEQLGDFKGTLICDAYSAYRALAKERDEVQLAGCWAHVRRQFAKITQLFQQKTATATAAHQAYCMINRLYKVEQAADQAGDTADERYQRRQAHSRPLVEQLETWCQKQIEQALPKASLYQAVQYTLNNMPHLKTFLEDGRVPIDNNEVERSIKPFATGRKNWLFSQSQSGARASAAIYSLVETCRLHDVPLYAYFKYMLTYVRDAASIDDYEALLPFNVPIETLAQQHHLPEGIQQQLDKKTQSKKKKKRPPS